MSNAGLFLCRDSQCSWGDGVGWGRDSQELVNDDDQGDDRDGRGEGGGLESLFQRGWEVEVKETEEE